MKNYKIIDLFGHVNKLPIHEQQFFESYLKELEDDNSRPPFERLFKVELDPRNGEPTFQIAGEDSSNQPQSFLEWKSFVSWTKLSSWRLWRRLRKNKIYLLPVGPFPDFIFNKELNIENTTLFDILLAFAEIFFPGVTFSVLPSVEFKELGCKTRLHPKTRQKQILVQDVLDQLDKARPKDAYAIVAILWIDMYPSEEGNHIVGEGAFQTGCAALGFSHYALRNSSINKKLQEKKTLPSKHHPTEESARRSHLMKVHSLTRCKNRSDAAQFKDGIIENEAFQEKEKAMTTSLRRQSGEYINTTPLHTSSEISLHNFAVGLKIPPLYSMRGIRSMSYTDLSSCHLMTVDKQLTCSFLSLKELDRQTRLSSSSWLQLFSDDTSGFSSSFEDFEIINTVEESLLSVKTNELIGNTTVIEALPVGTDFAFSCTVLWRLIRALSHEICHLFGLSHCFFYRCAMNTSHSIDEADSQPLFLCPVCLRKLQRMLKFDIYQRYRGLSDFLRHRSKTCCHENHLLSYCTVSRQGLQIDSMSQPVSSRCQFSSAVKLLSKALDFVQQGKEGKS